MKKFNLEVFVLSAAIFVFISGCGTVQNGVSEKIGEKVSEEVLEKAIGGNVDVTKDGINVNKDGAGFQSGNDLKWPKDSMGNLPEPKAKVTTVLNAGTKEGYITAFSEMSLDDAKAYVDKLKGLGYKESMSLFDADNISYAGINDSGESVMFLYNSSDKEGSIGYTPVED